MLSALSAALLANPSGTAAQQIDPAAQHIEPAARHIAEVRRAFEAGDYDRDVHAADPTPAIVFMAAQSRHKTNAVEQAGMPYRRLANRPETDAWRFAGPSAIQLILNRQTDVAAISAEHASKLAPKQARRHYQYSLVLARRQDWQRAAPAPQAHQRPEVLQIVRTVRGRYLAP